MALLPPDVAVSRLARPVGTLAGNLRAAAPALRARLGTWESDIEALNLLLLSAIHAMAICDLALKSVSFGPSASVLARSSMEAAGRAMWLLEPAEPMAREARWLAHLEAEADSRERLGRTFKAFSANSSAHSASAIRQFAEAVRDKLPASFKVPAAVPPFRGLLEAVGCPEKYLVYMLLSDATHASHQASGSYRRHLGTEKELGEFTTASSWLLPLSATWWFLATGVARFSRRTGTESPELMPRDLELAFANAQQTLKQLSG